MEPHSQQSPIRLAVRPLQALSEDERIQLFCKGLHMDLVTDLARFRSFHIISDEGVSTQNLQPDYLVKGIARYQGDRLQINLQLIQCHENRLVWAEKFGASLKDIFQIEEEIVQKIVLSLQQVVDHDLLSRMRSRTLSNLSAYENWLYGMEELKKGSLATDEAGRGFFLKAIEKDPSFARAYTGMSLSYFNEWSCLLWDKWEENQEQAITWALKAVELDTWDPSNYYILGKCFLFYKQYQKAEYHLRTVLEMNPSQPKILAGVAFCFMYLGYPEEGLALYRRALKLDPSKQGFILTGSLVHFENGLYEEAIQYGERQENKTAWIDFPATLAAAYFQVGAQEKMWSAWKAYVHYFHEKIRPDIPFDEGLALEWMMTVNPYRGYTHHQPFWEFMKSHLGASIEPRPEQVAIPVSSPNQFLQTGDIWQLSYMGKTVRMAELKGFHDLVRLLKTPKTAIHCADLMGLTVKESGVLVLDDQAKQSYQQRIREIQESLEEAESTQNYPEIERLQEEYDQLLTHLSQSLGKGGKARSSSGSLEKARSAVTWRIRAAIKKIEQVHPEMGSHLKVSIKTGLFCSYQPEQNRVWEV